MRSARPLLLLFAAWLPAGAAEAQQPAAGIGVAAPLSGPSEILGRQVLAGAGAAAAAEGVAVTTADDACTAEGGAAAAERFAAAKVSAVVGFLCTESIESAMPILKAAAIPVVTPGVRTDSLTDRKAKTGWPVFRVAPRGDAEREAVGRILTERWRTALFAIVDDGTIYGRELAESFRLAAEQAGLKPVFVDTYRPQLDNQVGLVGRLRKSGATHVFAGGDRDDIAILARDAAKLGVPLVIAGGEALRSAPGEVPLTEGLLMIGLPEGADGADPAVVAQLAASGIAAEGYVMPSYAAAQIAVAAARQAASDNISVAAALQDGRFETALGPIAFDTKGDLSVNPYRLYRHDGAAFVPAGDQE